MTKKTKAVLEKLEAARRGLDDLKSFRGKAGAIKKIGSAIEFMKVHRSDDICHLFQKEIEGHIQNLMRQVPDRKEDLDSVLKVCRGEFC